MNKTYIVRLTDDERQELVQLTKSGKAADYKIKHAHILLHVDANSPNWSDAHVATACTVMALQGATSVNALSNKDSRPVAKVVGISYTRAGEVQHCYDWQTKHSSSDTVSTTGKQPFSSSGHVEITGRWRASNCRGR